MAGHYWRCVPRCTTLPASITELWKKRKPDKLIWSRQCQQAFGKRKEAWSTSPVLVSQDFDEPFLVFAGASGTELGMVLMQTDGKGRRHPTAHLSKKLHNDTERFGYGVGRPQTTALPVGPRCPGYKHHSPGYTRLKGLVPSCYTGV